jgi:hypothetical protein
MESSASLGSREPSAILPETIHPVVLDATTLSPLADEGAKRYTREYGDRFGTGFNKATREMVANSLAEAFESDVRLGAIDPEALVGVASNPRKRRAR